MKGESGLGGLGWMNSRTPQGMVSDWIRSGYVFGFGFGFGWVDGIFVCVYVYVLYTVLYCCTVLLL